MSGLTRPRWSLEPIEVDLWLINVAYPDLSAGDRSELVAAAGSAWLAPEERVRAESMVSDRDAFRYVRAHVAARALLARRTEAAAHDLRWSVGINGKPEAVDGQEWNMSRSGSLAIVAMATAPVGVDVQMHDARIDIDQLSRRFLTSGTHRRVSTEDLWQRFSRLEACAKAVGGRLLDLLHLGVDDEGPVIACEGPWAGTEWWVSDLPAPSGTAAACATRGKRPHAWRMHWHDEDHISGERHQRLRADRGHPA